MNYDVNLFLEIIESIPGVRYLRDEEFEGFRMRLYNGINGKLVKIDVTDEDMYDNTAKGHLNLLGLSHLIPSMFPEQPDKTPETTPPENTPETDAT